jgi:hypothetical protein
MNPRPTGQSIVRSAIRAAAVLLLAAGPAAATPGVPLIGDPPREINLLKAPHEILHIRWSALVNEDGGEFVISRQGPGGSILEVAAVRPRMDGRYDVADHGVAGSWVYELRYRDRRGQELVLVTVRINVEKLDAARGTLTGGTGHQPMAVATATLVPTPAAAAGQVLPGVVASVGGPDRWPPTSPP